MPVIASCSIDLVEYIYSRLGYLWHLELKWLRFPSATTFMKSLLTGLERYCGGTLAVIIVSTGR